MPHLHGKCRSENFVRFDCTFAAKYNSLAEFNHHSS